LARYVSEGRLDEARTLWHALIPVVRAAFAEPNPAPVKAALALSGRIRNELRAPMTPASAVLEAELGKLVA
jgi:4-hydroxy-tetrahydrodipicolinate synthase